MVIDASVAVKWIVPEDDSGTALALLGEYHTAPILMLHEVGNALWKKKRRGELPVESNVSDQLDSIPQMIKMLPETGFVSRAFGIAQELNHPIYDCIYLAMAESLQTELITADLKFMRKVRQSGLTNLVRPL